MQPAVTLEPAPLDHIQTHAGLQPVQDLDQSLLALMTDNDVNKRFAQRLGRAETGVPPAKYDGQAGVQLADHPAHFDGVPDHGSRQKRDPETNAVLSFARDGTAVIAVQRAVDDHRLISRFVEGSSKTQQ